MEIKQDKNKNKFKRRNPIKTEKQSLTPENC